MTSEDGLDRRLTARLDEAAAPHAPHGLSEAVDERVARTRQRPAWATTERWISMETRARLGAVPRTVIVLATLALLTALAAGAIAIGSSSGSNLPPPFGAAANGLIAYVSEGDIYVVQPDGTGLRRITSGPEIERPPSWSRDGTRLAYWSGPEDGPGMLFVTDADGADPVMIARSQGTDYRKHEWSADGTEIMYEDRVPGLGSDPCDPHPSDGGACGSRLFVANTDGSGSRQVGDADLDARGPALSPDGTTVAFGGGEAASEALYLMDWDGSDIRRLETPVPGDTWAFTQQSWSPDGQRIATHDGRRSQSIWLVELDDSGALKAATSISDGFYPIHAPDGSGIIWNTSVTSTLVYTTGDEASSTPFIGVRSLVWSRDGSRLAGVRGGTLFVSDRDGEDLIEIGVADDENPSWQRVAP